MEYPKVSIDITYLQHRYFYRVMKRGFDVVASFTGMVVLSPVFLVVGLAIKLEDPHGPVFYEQVRLGKLQKEFLMFKFRSMCVDADEKLKNLQEKNEVSGAMFKMKSDPRITRVGHFIRRYSIDELPQLLNVFLGEMSLVGPRPPLPEEVKSYSSYDLQRLDVKPGCTGLWQISGRSDVGFDEMIRLDLEYINHSSMGFDLYLLMRTVRVFFKPNGAY